MPVECERFEKTSPRSPRAHVAVRGLATRFHAMLNAPEVEAQIDSVHVVGASSAEIQKIVHPLASRLGFAPEKKGLFSGYRVPELRPDFFMRVEDAGVLLEIERGKTTTNNMDLLDLWKCHICVEAEYLFLVVPNARPSKNGRVMRHFKQVRNRLSTFFEPRSYVNVEGVYLFGYGKS